MQFSNLIPDAIVKSKRFWVPAINGARIIKFLREAYSLDDPAEQHHSVVKSKKNRSLI